MKRFSFVLSTAGVVAGLLALSATPARADDVNKQACLTFSAPVALPAVVLPAGSYIFKHPDGANDRHIVQVFSSDAKQLLGTFLTVPEERSKPSADIVVTFKESPAGMPEAVKSWYYPSETVGDEFVYPREEAIKIARVTNQSVLSTRGSLSTEAGMQRASVERVTATGAIEEPKPVGTSGMRASNSPMAKSSILAPCTAR
jgi:hypothetical protein